MVVRPTPGCVVRKAVLFLALALSFLLVLFKGCVEVFEVFGVACVKMLALACVTFWAYLIIGRVVVEAYVGVVSFLRARVGLSGTALL